MPHQIKASDFASIELTNYSKKVSLSASVKSLFCASADVIRTEKRGLLNQKLDKLECAKDINLEAKPSKRDGMEN